MFGPNPNAVHPNENIPSVCYIKNTITRPNIIVGEYTYYDDPENSEDFERHVTHHYEFIGDKLIIGKFCAIAKGVEFIMNGANHRMNSISTYPFNIMGSGWEKATPTLGELPLKGDSAIIGACSVVASDVPPYCVAVGNPCEVIKKRFDDSLVEYLLNLKWWDWDAEKIFKNLEALTSADLSKIEKIK